MGLDGIAPKTNRSVAWATRSITCRGIPLKRRVGL
nr:MAG TPA: hypothetical protein [Caudoviricetes sp.]